jgi:hypothetical protein
MLRLFQVARRVGILGVEEGAGLGAFGIFQPAVVVNDLRSEVIVHHRDCLDGRWRRQGDALAAMNRLGERAHPAATQSKAPHPKVRCMECLQPTEYRRG